LAVACTPAVSLLAVRHASIPEILAWDQLVARFPGCRIGHTRAWLRSLEACGKGDPLYLVFERGVVGLLGQRNERLSHAIDSRETGKKYFRPPV